MADFAPPDNSSYDPSVPPAGEAPANPDDQLNHEKLAAEVLQHFQDARAERRKHEGRWFLNGAMLRGQQHVEFDAVTAKLVTPPAPSYRIKLDLNRIRPKCKARWGKFFKNRPKPVVVPASTEFKDQLNARATEKMLNYQFSRLNFEEMYRDARIWSGICHRSYMWLSIDPFAEGRIRVNAKDPLTGAELPDETEDKTATIGDVLVEVASAFETLVADPAISRIGLQPWIQRVRWMDKADVLRRYPALAEADEKGELQTETKGKDAAYEDRIATLHAAGGGGTVKRGPRIMLIEEFRAPCADYPKGLTVCVVGKKVAKATAELPYGFASHVKNPYPVVEFSDGASPGQYWGTTFIEQLIGLQRHYNMLHELMLENVRACARPKILVYTQHGLKDGAWTTSSGEIVTLNYIPGLPPPQILQPANVASDVWNLIQLCDRLFDELSQIYPSSEGQVGKTTSGFQTNLLQEATDSVHAPDVREDELAIQEAAWKIRRLCKIWYDVPRLFAITGERSLPEVIEFSRDQIDENAEVRIQAGSMLPEMKAAKTQALLELFDKGLFGTPDDPLVRKRVLSQIDLNGVDVVQENERLDTDEAEMENQKLTTGIPVEPANIAQEHLVHLDRHFSVMKSSTWQSMDEAARQNFMGHIIGHFDWHNAPMGLSLRMQYGFDLNSLPLATPPPPQMMTGQNPGAPAPGAEAPSPSPLPPPVPPNGPMLQ